ncbi:MAG: hypothetical protein LQ346_002812 [Caloplaca aetnensis]|nr:MAG: hypothetical protein LQ346_002812 [Caloplaca aetnensis]
MAEVVALFASVITIAALVKEGVRKMRTFLRASEEIVALQEQIEDFAALVSDIKEHHAGAASQAIPTALFRATVTLGHLHSIIKTKVIREQNVTVRAVRRTWARNRTNVFRLQDQLKENRLSLIAAMSAHGLYSSSRSTMIALDQDQRLVDIQQTVTSTHHAVVAQAAAVNRLLQSISGRSWGRHLEQPNFRQPASPLEPWGNFFPETYTIDDRFPICLFIIKSYQQSSFGDFKANWYKLFLMKSPREWYRLTVSVNIHRSSVYWAHTQISSRDPDDSDEGSGPLACNASLPYTFQPRMQALLAAKDLKNDAHFNFLLTRGASDRGLPWELHIRAQTITTKASSKNLEAWGFIDDLGCPRIHESEVTQVELLEAPNHFLSCLHGRMVVEIRFSDALPSCELLYNIRVLHCMRGSILFTRLIGVVVDEQKMQLKSFLIDYPQATRSLEEMARVEGVPWHQREKWARQLVEGVHQLHSKGFVAGKLFSIKSPVLIDATQTIQFWCVKSKFQPGRWLGDWYPPEFRYVSGHL